MSWQSLVVCLIGRVVIFLLDRKRAAQISVCRFHAVPLSLYAAQLHTIGAYETRGVQRDIVKHQSSKFQLVMTGVWIVCIVCIITVAINVLSVFVLFRAAFSRSRPVRVRVAFSESRLAR
jgi:hypothetical protein